MTDIDGFDAVDPESGYYVTRKDAWAEEGEEAAPQLLAEYRGLTPGMRVLYRNPAWRQPDGTYRTAGMDPPLVIDELVTEIGGRLGEGEHRGVGARVRQARHQGEGWPGGALADRMGTPVSHQSIWVSSPGR
jgi:hypothetical protein